MSSDLVDQWETSTASSFPNKDQKTQPSTTDETVVNNQDLSPLVKSMSWGRVDVEGINEHFKDVKLYPGGK